MALLTQEIAVNDAKENAVNNGLEDLLNEIEAATAYFEEQVSEGKMTVDQAMLMADSAFEKKKSTTPTIHEGTC